VTIPHLDPGDPAYRANPYPVLAQLREADPVHWSPALKGWVVTRYEDVQTVMRAAAMSADRITPFYASLPSETRSRVESLVRYLGRWLVFRDPPDHTRLRGLIARAFTPKALADIRPNVEAIVAHLLERIESTGRDEIDLVAEFANLLPAYVIMDMLGVPRAMLPQFKAWSDDIRLFIGTAKATPDKYERTRRGVEAMADAFRALIAEHRLERRHDVLQTLIDAHEEGSGRLTDDELIATSILFLFAGHETTTALIAVGSAALVTHPAERNKLVALDRPEAIASAVEEMLRYDGPTPAMVRVALQDHTIGGKRIASGDRVYTMIAAANRDPAVFHQPDRFDISRSPNPHMTFGFGTHFCLGAPLARLEAQIALPRLHRAYPEMDLCGGDLDWADGLVLRGPAKLMVRLGRRSAS